MIDRIKLKNCDEHLLKLILKGDDFLAEELKINIPNNWTEFGEPIFNFSLDILNKNPDAVAWLTYLPILIESNTLIGSCGFKGVPDSDGNVEIGYEVAMDFRNNGYATEIVGMLKKIAFNEIKVNGVIAQTLADNIPSISVLKKWNFKFVEELEYEEEGKVLKWILNR